MKFRIPYYLQNNGDGSYSLIKTRTFEEAHKACDEQPEGSAENSAAYFEVEVDVDRPNTNIEISYDVQIELPKYKYRTEKVLAEEA